ncbi:hypothetical protein [Dongshaea marina]|uniref:hypothetical protein n=1 Tax=Dongshaea marina TaxID=2047966 RepID=UPI000D3EC84C|nr:hypothetical protein [Dongshaea marina]
MKYKYWSVVLFPVILLISGCNGSGDTSNNNITAKSSVLVPDTNYAFTQEKLDDLLRERREFLNSATLDYKVPGKSIKKYQIKYGMEAWKGQALLMFKQEQDPEASALVMQVPMQPDEKSECYLWNEGDSDDQRRVFDCSIERTSSMDGESIDFINVPDSGGLGYAISLPFHKDLTGIGSARFTVTGDSTGVYLIRSSNPFAKQNVEFTTLGVSSYLDIAQILESKGINQNITLEFDNFVGGSVDDDINMYTGLMLREYEVKTRLSAKGSVASGGVDLFSAGVERSVTLKKNGFSIADNQRFGVHSWDDEDDKKQATDYPLNHPAHSPQATYFKRMLGDKGVPFYLFTIKAAPADGMHYMTRAELDRYQLITQYQ